MIVGLVNMKGKTLDDLEMLTILLISLLKFYIFQIIYTIPELREI